MSGLLLKDLYNMRRLVKQYALVGIFALVWGYIMKTGMYFAFMSVMLGAMSVLTGMSYDEMAQFEKYALTMPVTRKDLVKVKYMLFLVLLVTSFLIGIIGSTILNILLGQSLSVITESIVSALSIGCVFIIAFSILIPLVFKMGVEKARMIMVVVYLGVFGGIYGGLTLLLKSGFVLTNQMVVLGIAVGALVAILFLAISYVCSLRIVNGKEW